MIRVGAIGYGYWGPNVVRNLQATDGFQLMRVADLDPASLRRAQKAHPNLQVTTDANDILKAKDIDLVAVVTPVWTHYELAKAALLNGKHIFVEKPFTFRSEQAEELIELAERKGLTIMVDHTFLFTGAVRKIRQLVDDGTLGDLYYYDSVRVNLGLFQHDVNVIWDLAPHDLSILDYLFESRPEAVVATGERHLNGHEDIAFITLYFPDNVIAHLNVNWISPVKVRTTMIGGEKKMLLWDDVEIDEKIKVYDRGVSMTGPEGVRKAMVSYRSGDVWIPKVEHSEALRTELTYLLECIEQSRAPVNDGLAGWRVVKMLEAADRSVKSRGEIVLLSDLTDNARKDVVAAR